jgi:hypothetical protein
VFYGPALTDLYALLSKGGSVDQADRSFAAIVVISTMMVKIEVVKVPKVVAEYEVAVEVIVYVIEITIEDHEDGNPETNPGTPLL